MRARGASIRPARTQPPTRPNTSRKANTTAALGAKMDGDPESARELDAARSELDAALDELRELARGIHPSVLSDRGLEAAVDGLAQRAPLPVEVERMAPARLPDRIESAAYFVIAEALTKVAKYARATHASVSLTCDDARVLLEARTTAWAGATPRAAPACEDCSTASRRSAERSTSTRIRARARLFER
jgi:signal transduction histidine kinase